MSEVTLNCTVRSCPQSKNATFRMARDSFSNIHFGDSFLSGLPIASDFPLELFQEKWTRRFVNESDDRPAAPRTALGSAWDGIVDGKIPWTALKSAGRAAGRSGIRWRMFRDGWR